MALLSKILASTWNDGVFVLKSDSFAHELPERMVRGLSDDLVGGAFAAIDDHHLFQRKPTGQWERIASSEHILSVTFAVDNKVYVGTDDARVLILNSHGTLDQIDRFASIRLRAENPGWLVPQSSMEKKLDLHSASGH